MKRKRAKQMKMNGKTIEHIYNKQLGFQTILLTNKQHYMTLPCDNVDWFVYHTNAMIEEMGELLKSDKRWKTHRNTAYDRNNKLEELSDVFITALNIALFSGFACDELMGAINSKINSNMMELQKKINEV